MRSKTLRSPESISARDLFDVISASRQRKVMLPGSASPWLMILPTYLPISFFIKKKSPRIPGAEDSREEERRVHGSHDQRVQSLQHLNKLQEISTDLFVCSMAFTCPVEPMDPRPIFTSILPTPIVPSPLVSESRAHHILLSCNRCSSLQGIPACSAAIS